MTDAFPAYCTNIHAYTDLPSLLSCLGSEIAAVKSLAAPGRALPLGLWWPAKLVSDLACEKNRGRLRGALAMGGFQLHTVNVFPYSRFHGQPLKEKVYEPSWWKPARGDYTVEAARALSFFLEEGQTGTLSTLAGGFRRIGRGPERLAILAEKLALAVAEIELICRRQGCDMVLCLEPEPETTLESTGECLGFFSGPLATRGSRLLARALGCSRGRAEAILRRRLGICLDACHLAVLFEDLPQALGRLLDNGIRVAKLQLSSALRVVSPAEDGGFEKLAACAEPTYLHQTVALMPDGSFQRALDVCRMGSSFRQAVELRTHFHVPVFFKADGPLLSTRSDLERLLGAVSEAGIDPCMEIETYTWSVLPRGAGADELVSGIAREIAWVRGRLCSNQESADQGAAPRATLGAPPPRGEP